MKKMIAAIQCFFESIFLEAKSDKHQEQSEMVKKMWLLT